MMGAIVIHLLITVLPGYLLVILLGIRRQQLLFSVAFSSGVLIALVSLTRNYILGPSELLTGYAILTAFLGGLLWFAGRPLLHAQGSALAAAWGNAAWRNGLLATAVLFLAWYAWTGPYTEVPADLFRHLEFTRIQLGYIEQGNLGPPLRLTHLVTQHGGFWYVLIALEAWATGSEPDALLAPVMGMSGLLFLLAVYTFSHRLAESLLETPRARSLAAFLAALFTALQLGTSAFSFVRYYSLAPVILNCIVFLAAQVCLLDLLARREAYAKGRRLRGVIAGNGLLWLICFGIALVMHQQEGLFILLMGVATLAWVVVDRWLRSGASVGRNLTLLILACSALYCIGILGLELAFDRSAIPVDGSGKVVALPLAVPGFGPLHILHPGYQFAETITIWGGLVALLFISGWRHFREQPWLVAGMLLPLLTVFNPVFVDIYLRIEGEHSLWRLLFLVPLAQVAAIWVVRAFSGAGRATLPRWLSLPATALLFLLVVPGTPVAALNPHVRSTNLPVPEANSAQYWGDLVDAMNALPGSEQVLTDPVTGYVLSALTPHRTFRYKFFADALYQAFPFAFDDYTDDPLSRYRGWLLAVNLRDGATSETGRRSGHWPADIMQVSRYYPEALRQHLAAHPDRYGEIWSGGDITLYRIAR